MSDKKIKFFIFSDESGSWHECNEENIYLRAWVVIAEDNYLKLKNKIQEIVGFLDCRELRWKTLSGPNGAKYATEFNHIDFRIFITISVPRDINWAGKYRAIKNFDKGINNFDFGGIDINLKDTLRKKIFDDIKYVIFLNYYEKVHINNARKRIEQVIAPKEYELIYRIDPPQSTKKDWGNILASITDKKLEFPKSERDEGIQFADVVAGSFRSLIKKDDRYNIAKIFFKNNKNKFLSKSKEIPNPNLIFWPEVNNGLKKSIGEIWKI